MNDKVENEVTIDNWKTKTLIAGTLVGALVGIGAAYLLIQKADQKDEQVNVAAGDGLKVGLTVLGLLRQVAQLGE